MRLYHFTCDHGYAKITADGYLRPNQHPMLGGLPMIWLTHIPHPTNLELGLSGQRLITCDRMAHRIEVETDLAEPWQTARTGYNPEGARLLEAAKGVRPGSWWLALVPLPIHTDGSGA